MKIEGSRVLVVGMESRGARKLSNFFIRVEPTSLPPN